MSSAKHALCLFQTNSELWRQRAGWWWSERTRGVLAHLTHTAVLDQRAESPSAAKIIPKPLHTWNAIFPAGLDRRVPRGKTLMEIIVIRLSYIYINSPGANSLFISNATEKISDRPTSSGVTHQFVQCSLTDLSKQLYPV